MSYRTIPLEVSESIYDGPKGAKQSMKAECDINNIMRQFTKTGIVSHVSEHKGNYGVAPTISYHEAMDVVARANEMFASVPAKIRKRFNNDPALYSEFISDPANAEEMIKLEVAVKHEPVLDPMQRLGDVITKAIAKMADRPFSGGPGAQPSAPAQPADGPR